MKLTKLLYVSIGIMVLNLACSLSSYFPQILTVNTPTLPFPGEELPVGTPTRIPFPTLTPQPTPTPPYPTAPSIPAWVTDFADPILKAVTDQRPDIKDDFSPYNQGWFTFNTQNRSRPYYAHVRDGALYLEFQDTTERRDLMVYNHKWVRENFVLSFDFKFGKTEPTDSLRFQYAETADETLIIDLSKNENWTFFWNLQNNFQSSTGSYDYFSPEYLNVLIIMRGEECAIFLNHHPVDYSNTCRRKPIGRLSRFTMTFHLLGSGPPVVQSHPVQVIIDNLILWDLDNPPDLP